MSKGSEDSPETSGRRFGESPDTCHVPIATSTWDFPQTVWLNASTHNAVSMAGLDTGSWYHSYTKSGIEVGRFLKKQGSPAFLKALREELENG